MLRVNTYADPVYAPVPCAPTATVSPSIDTLMPNWALAAASSAVSFATCVQPEAGSPGVSRVNTYADPLLAGSSSRFAPITIVSPSIDTLTPNSADDAPSSAVSLAIRVQPEVRSPAVTRANTYADPVYASAPCAPITIVSLSIETL